MIRDRELIEQLVAATYVGYDSKTGTPQKWILGASVVIFVGIHVKRSGSRYGELGVALGARLDCAAAVQNMLLGATALGLGATWVVGYDEDKVSECLDLPGDVIPFSLIPIGHPARVPAPPYRLPVEDIVDYR